MIKKAATFVCFLTFWVIVIAYLWVIWSKWIYDREDLIMFFASIGLLGLIISTMCGVTYLWKKKHKSNDVNGVY